MTIFEIDPRQDARWNSFIGSHEQSSIFHRSEWLDALCRTYGYTAKAFTTSPPDAPLSNALVFCEIRSWLTGSKLVSLPFSDHCDPLVNSPSQLNELLSAMARKVDGAFRFAEIRPRLSGPESESAWSAMGQYHFHHLDLRPSLDQLYSRLHKDGMQRKIRRADREGLVLTQGRSDPLILEFYQLLLRTRRRHRLPPQPLAWFRNLAEAMGDRLSIHI